MNGHQGAAAVVVITSSVIFLPIFIGALLELKRRGGKDGRG
jgi:hypothetical protein